MRESKNCYHRFSVHKENIGFLTDDGIDLFIAGARFQKNNSGGHMEFPIVNDEIISTSLIERRNELQTPKSLYFNLMIL
ncbi:hypothetical protein [Bacillus sp. B15-48]|uniref:hypothetical protein n=1 Tax=Bacillus sp. B15-48 TaxID=1548601 RepID=UPI00193ECF34|nr:hypothetical protein [Bacillus sp. B15-48]MBM4761964.1 hypothetical protein [Bacillus sp. B15-48]